MITSTRVEASGTAAPLSRVLVIDSNADHQGLTVVALAPRGFQVKAASSAREGLLLLETESFDAILFDAKLRDVGVPEFIAILASKFPNLPRILLVPAGGEERALRGLDAGATAFVMKSPSFSSILPAVVDRQIREVRAHRQMQDALRESQRVLSTLMSNLPGMAYRCRNNPPIWTTEFVSDGAEPLTGYSADAFERGVVTFGGLIHPEDLERVTRTIDEAIRAKRPFQVLYRLRTATGPDKWVWEQGRAVYASDGAVHMLEGFVSDVTEKEMARDQLERSERMFRAIFEDAADGILRIDANGTLLAINPAGSEFLGRPPSEIIGHLLDEFLPPEEVPRARGYLHDLLTHVRSSESFETAIVSPRVGRRTIEMSARMIHPSQGTPQIELVARDITERRELLHKIAESERLASLGRLSLYVAHEINTPLTSISLLATAIERNVSDPAILAKIEKIHSERRRAAAIISGLLNFSRPQRVEGKETDLRVLVQAAVEHVEPMKKTGVSLSSQFVDRPILAVVDPSQMESVVVSLLKNALEATSHGSVVVQLNEAPDHITIRVSDTGEGMSKQVLERIFEPFFTTKRLGHGTGMGLAWSRRIVEGHGGRIDVTSKSGDGSVFTITLPRSPAPPPAAVPGWGATNLLSRISEPAADPSNGT